MDTERSVRHGDCSQKRFVRFLQARPIFLKDYDGAGNCQAGFARAVDDLGPLMPGEAIIVYVTAGTSYRLYVNGRFAAHGPARTTENYLRVDAVDVSELVKAGRNIFAFEVFHCGNPYGEYSNDIARGKALLQAEIVRVRGNGGNNDNSAELIDATSPRMDGHPPVAACAARGADIPLPPECGELPPGRGLFCLAHVARTVQGRGGGSRLRVRLPAQIYGDAVV